MEGKKITANTESAKTLKYWPQYEEWLEELYGDTYEPYKDK